MIWPRLVGLAVGTAADRFLADPQRHHPVAAFGTWAMTVEGWVWHRSTPRGELVRGAVHGVACLAPALALGLAAERASRHHPLWQAGSTALAAWAVTGGESLAREGESMARHLADDDLGAARERLPHLCGRLAEALDEPELARAALESVAENSADAVVAPLFWGALAGIPGLLVHRAVNTLDAMVGHRNDRYEHFGTVAARCDDALCWLPARLTGALTCALAGTRRDEAWRVMRRDAHDHPSPNGGWCEAAFAGALGVQLGGRNVYPGGRVEHRGLLGEGPRPGAEELRAAAVLSRRVQLAATALVCVVGGLASAGQALRRTPQTVHPSRRRTTGRTGAARTALAAWSICGGGR